MDRRRFFKLLVGTAAAILVPELWVPKKTYFLPLGNLWWTDTATRRLWLTAEVNNGYWRPLTFEEIQKALEQAVEACYPDWGDRDKWP